MKYTQLIYKYIHTKTHTHARARMFVYTSIIRFSVLVYANIVVQATELENQVNPVILIPQ